MKATIKRESGEDNLNDAPLTGDEGEVSGDGCSDAPLGVDDEVVPEGQKGSNLPPLSTSDGNNNESGDVNDPESLILSSEKEVKEELNRISEAEDAMLTQNKEEVGESDVSFGCSFQADEDTTDLMTAICRALPELQSLNPTRERRHSCEFRQDASTEARGSSRYCRRGTAPSLLFTPPQVPFSPECDDARLNSICNETHDMCPAHENSSFDEPHPEKIKDEEHQNDTCVSQAETEQKIEDDEKTKETILETPEVPEVEVAQDSILSDQSIVESGRDCGKDDACLQTEVVLETRLDESQVRSDESEGNTVKPEDNDADQDYEIEITVGENTTEDSFQTATTSTESEMAATTGTEGASQNTDGEPRYATVVKGQPVPVAPDEAKYVNCQVVTSETQEGGPATPGIEAESVEHVYDCPKEVGRGSGCAKDITHALESGVSGVCRRQEAGCEGVPATSEPVYETIEDRNERDNNNEGNGPDCGKVTS